MTKTHDLIFEAVSKTSKGSKSNVNVFEYQVLSNSASEIPPERINRFRKAFLLRPTLSIILLNIVLLTFLIAIGFGISIGISNSSLKNYGDFCNLTSECSQNDYLICSNYKCSCASGRYYQNFGCMYQKSYMSPCSKDTFNECGYGLYCMFNNSGTTQCLCSTDRFWNTTSNYCNLKLSFNQTGCSDSSHCVNNLNLECSNSKCTCTYPNYWNGMYCSTKQTYLQTCSIEQGCDESRFLNCSLNGDNNKICDCDFTRYWSPSILNCTSRKTNGINCTSSNECRVDQGLNCITSSGVSKCSCSTHFYWTGTQCLIKKNRTEACSASIPCNENYGLVCTAGTCQCPTNYFYDGSKCQYYIYTGFSCNSTFLCDSNLFLQCDILLKQCVCPSNQFWNNTLCVNKFVNGSSCIRDIQCDTTKFLSCDSTQKMCLCAFDNYWTGTTCTNKLALGVGCSQTYQCKDHLGLICSTNCVCPPDYYWDGTKCTPQLTYWDTCTFVTYEPCLQSKSLSCQSGRCRCNVVDKYWDNTNCVPKLLYGASCIYEVTTRSNAQCADYGTYSLICLPTSLATNTWTCQCPTTKYYDLATGQCINRRTYNQACTSSIQCQDYFGLICYSNNTCLCPSTRYWDSAASLCKEKLPYNEACVVTANSLFEMCQDYAFIYCIGGTCLCDSSRYYDTTYLACLPRSNHNQKCTSDIHCMTSASAVYQLTCKSNTCQCRNYDTDWNTGAQVYWSTSLNRCEPCPTGYKTGYGMGTFGSPNRITNRCYRIETNQIYNYNDAQNQCFNTNGNQANLVTIRNIMEMEMIRTQIINGLGAINFLTGSITTTYLSFKWIYNNNVDVQNTLWCNNQPDNSGGNQNVLILDNGYCLNDFANGNAYGFICEKG